MPVTITPTLGSAAALSAAATSIAFSAAAQMAGQIIVVGVAILDTTKSVSGISDGVNTYTLQSAGNNSTNVRVEEWACAVASSATRTITVSFTGSTLAAAAYEEYGGPPSAVGTYIPSIYTANSSLPAANGAQPIQDIGNWFVAAIAMATTAGDTISALDGNLRQSAIPTVTGAAIALVDFGPFNYGIYAWAPGVQIVSGALRQSAGADLQLRTGNGSPLTITGRGFLGPVTNPKSAACHQAVKSMPLIIGNVPSPVAQILQTGAVGSAYAETISGTNGTSPFTFSVMTGTLPAGTSLTGATGVISGTPMAAGTYSFTIQATDANGLSGQFAFEIVVIAPTTGGGGNFCWAG